MTSIKTYKLTDETENQIVFDIKKMEDIYDKNGGTTDTPHRHDFYIILLVSKAKGAHIIDFNEFLLEDRQAFFLSPGQVHQIKEEQKSYGWVITFSRQFLAKNNINYRFIEDINLFQDYGHTPPLYLNELQLKQLNAYSSQIFNTYSSNSKFKLEAIGALLKLFLIYSNNICDIETKDPQQLHVGSVILKEYKNLVEKHFSDWHKVQQYAEALHVTPDHLNRTIKSLIGKTAKEYLQSRIIIAAKRLLSFSDKTTKEIGYDLGFTEPANFSNFFKKCTSFPPSYFRQKI
ncbi:AraC family transcriptional regulator [Aquimarina sp. BL5]|uniref:AraC family transcriptional regulator n=1 Tax=Aquimarina sp. BL5 TaxID=1714860 RepID=UPI000E550ABE|nr:helix-turn-helix domain-containing protein [Aquimarina sp. BL5]AXT53342.1 AraC family transcriptional regulator [Aquimarina sp. BL5]RKN06197.1 helix-turn-helix domain-containing protein [Aquimarina sp. BL5]